jgi:hypothetical protein
VLHEPLCQRIYGAENGAAALSRTALREGVLVHVGAQRFAFLLLEPAGSVPPGGRVVRPPEAAAAQAARLDAIHEAFAAEKVERGMADFARILRRAKTRKQGGITVERVRDSALKRDTLRVKTRVHQLVIDVLAGARVRSWTVGGVELVSKDPASGLALDGFWHPGKMLTGPMELAEHDVREGQARVTLRGWGVGGLPGLELEKTFEIDGSSSAFTVRTRLRNAGEGALEFSHRYHNMPIFLECREGNSGMATFGDGGTAVFTRQFKRHMFLFAGAAKDNLLTKAFDMAQTSNFSDSSVTFGAAWIPLQVRAELDGKALHSVVFWDSQAMPCATFEPIHARITLDPGEQWEVGSMRWSVVDE